MNIDYYHVLDSKKSVKKEMTLQEAIFYAMELNKKHK